jgi:hypothetical protein
MAVVDGDEIGRPDEEIDVAGVEPALLARLEVDAVENRVEIAVVGFNLRVLRFGPRVFDRERMKRKGIGQEQRFRNRRRGEIDPKEGARRRIQPGPIDALDSFGLAVAVDVDRDQR